jgi:hypothetical protein
MTASAYPKPLTPKRVMALDFLDGETLKDSKQDQL